MAIKAAARKWWVKLDSDIVSSRDRAEFERWLVADIRHQQAFDRLRAIWGELDAIEPKVALPAAAAKPSFWRWHWALPTLATGCLALWLIGPLSIWLRADFHTGFGEVRDIHLSDGSTAHLNSNSALVVRIDGNQRQLTLLQGEAWFEVSPDKTRPFQVHAERGTVTALGTAFNVRLQENMTEVSVTQHSVAIDVEKSGGQSLHTILAEGRQLAYSPKTGLSDTKKVDGQMVTAWQRRKLVFENRPLGEVIAELNRYHRGLLLINDPELAQRRVNGVFRTDQPLAVLAALETSLKLHSTRVGDYLILLHR